MAEKTNKEVSAPGAKTSPKSIVWTCNNKMLFKGESGTIDLRKASQKKLGILKNKYPQHFKA